MLKQSLRTLVLTLFVFAFVLVIGGCGGKKEEVKTEVAKAPAEKVVKKEVETPVEKVEDAEINTSTDHVAPPPKNPEADLQMQKQKILEQNKQEIEAVTPPPKTSSRSKAKFKDHSGG